MFMQSHALRYNNSNTAPSPRFGKYICLNLLRASIAIAAINTQFLPTQRLRVCYVPSRGATYTPFVKGRSGTKQGAAWHEVCASVSPLLWMNAVRVGVHSCDCASARAPHRCVHASVSAYAFTRERVSRDRATNRPTDQRNDTHPKSPCPCVYMRG